MTGPWEIKFPPPVIPVRSGDAIKERKPPPRRPNRPPPEQEQDKPKDDERPHIDDYA